MIVLTVLGVLTSVIYIGLVPLLVVGIWMLVDAFLIPGMIESLTRDARERISNEIAAMATVG